MQAKSKEHIHGTVRRVNGIYVLGTGAGTSLQVAAYLLESPAPAPNGSPPNPPCEPNITCIYWRSAGSKSEEGGRPAPPNGDIGAAIPAPPVGDDPDWF